MKDAFYLIQKKRAREPISMLTCYDYPSACIQEECGIDVIFVGDSLGTNVLGQTHQNEVTLDEIRHHLRAVARGVQQSYLLVDLPHHASQTTADIVASARTLVAQGAQGVKFETFDLEAFRQLAALSIDTWGHLGYTPQLIEKPSMQGKEPAAAAKLIEQAKAIEAAGAVGIIVELVPEALAEQVAKELKIPVIGIGAGRLCDGQVQVWHDMIGLEARKFRHAIRLGEAREEQKESVRKYLEAVATRT